MASKEFWKYLIKLQRQFREAVQESKSDEEMMYRLQMNHAEHEWYSFICKCKNLVRWKNEKKASAANSVILS